MIIRTSLNSRWVLASVALLLMAYVAVRATVLSITNDEALTYLIYIRRSFADIVLYNTPGLPDNNHLLFSLLAKCSVWAFGLGEVAERLPTILAFSVFVICFALTLRSYVTGAAFWIYLLFVVFNPYVIDLMSVARGYGLGIALLTAGLWALLRPAAGRGRFLHAEILFAAAALAHFSLLLPFLALLCLHMVNAAVQLWRKHIDKRAILVEAASTFIVAAVLAAIVIGPISIIKAAGLFSLTAEGATSFFDDSVRSVVAGSLRGGDTTAPVATAMAAACYFAVGIAVAALLWSARQNRLTPAWTALVSVTFILLATAVGSVLQHHLLGVAYLWERQAVFLLPIFGLMCALTGHQLDTVPGTLRRVIRAFWIVFPLSFLPFYAAAVNLTGIRDWAYDSDTKAMIGDLRQHGAERPLTLGTRWFHEASITFYIEKHGLTHLKRTTVRTGFCCFDLYYLPESDLAALEAELGHMTVLRTYANAGTVLVSADPAFRLSSPGHH